MGKTYRHKRPAMMLGYLEKNMYKSGLVRDGTPTHASHFCEHHGGCPYCESNRSYSTTKREQSADSTKNDVLDADDLVPDGYFYRLAAAIKLMPVLKDDDNTNDPPPLF